MKKIFISVLVVITVICIIGGTTFHILKRFSGSFHLWNWESGAELDHSRVTYSEVLDSFENITIEGSVLDITVKSGNSYSLSYDCVSYLVPDISLENDTLTIIQPAVPHFGGSNNYCQMTLTVPSKSVLNELYISTDVGDVSVSELTSYSATIQSDVGELDIEKCSFTISDLSADVGDVETSNCSLGEGSAVSDVGDVEIRSCDFTRLNVSADVGDISIDSHGDLSAYQVDLSTDMGAVTVNGENHKKNFNQQSSGSSNSLTAYTSLGDIDLSY